MSEDVLPHGPATSLQFAFRCPHCRREHRIEGDGEINIGYQCSFCHGWARVVVSGPYHEFKVDKGAAPTVRS